MLVSTLVGSMVWRRMGFGDGDSLLVEARFGGGWDSMIVTCKCVVWLEAWFGGGWGFGDGRSLLVEARFLEEVGTP